MSAFNQKSFRIWLIASLLVSAGGFLWGPGRLILFDTGNDVPDPSSVTVCIWFGWAWIAIFAGAIFWHRWRALWLMLGAPFALIWPYLWIFVAKEDVTYSAVDIRLKITLLAGY